mmetsp:Transcript_16488/g.47418  ORF Transcript_16488/g.47418 Transcript_16488/m.47418 type:complete len:211 (+) Transcript_16488:1712-2344(+)
MRRVSHPGLQRVVHARPRVSRRMDVVPERAGQALPRREVRRGAVVLPAMVGKPLQRLGRLREAPHRIDPEPPRRLPQPGLIVRQDPYVRGHDPVGPSTGAGQGVGEHVGVDVRVLRPEEVRRFGQFATVADMLVVANGRLLHLDGDVFVSALPYGWERHCERCLSLSARTYLVVLLGPCDIVPSTNIRMQDCYVYSTMLVRIEIQPRRCS